MGKDPGPLKFSCRAAGSTNGPSALWGAGGKLSQVPEGNAPGPGRQSEPLTVKTSISDMAPWSVRTKTRHLFPRGGRTSHTVERDHMCSWDKILLSLENTSFSQLLAENDAMHQGLQPVFPG